MCSREYGRVDDPDENRWPRIGKDQAAPESPFLLNIRLGKDGRLRQRDLPMSRYGILMPAFLPDRGPSSAKGRKCHQSWVGAG
jgi:hypothetical protein